ncbi:DUF1573 domain-containing protein [Robertkochia solimangrovi]|uniref:DUF1573 domain-containing protein n=1 Tax=Robertkochia solimangrovi TaxID=2213046 RepID=UPI00117CB887|nr:DUF1573 domain-containing protein [Robertkochia solimangrovi]TRZ41446.1 hypothetical protein DMZ48_17335 [Robertkochia solimangrovi]
MKKLLMLLFVGLTYISVSAQEKVAKIEFKSDVIDYGEIAQGSDGVRIFEFTNTGNAPLIITSVKSTCGCTIPKKPEEPILPGKMGKIEVKYDTNRPGHIRKTIMVTSNADTPNVSLKIKGKVIPPDSGSKK